MQQIQDFQLGGSEKHIGVDDPRCALQENGGLADQWYSDDGDILCHRILALSYLSAFDTANVKIGAERKTQKIAVIYYLARPGCSPARVDGQ